VRIRVRSCLWKWTPSYPLSLRERVGVRENYERSSFITNSIDHLSNNFGITQDVVIPESHDMDTFASQKRRPSIVVGDVRWFRVLSTISLDHDFHLMAVEIDDVITDRDLAAEFKTSELSVSKNAPHSLFRIRAKMPHAPSKLQEALVGRRFWKGLFRQVRFS